MRVIIAGFLAGLGLMRPVQVDLHREALRHKVLIRKSARHLEAVRPRDVAVRRQCQNHFARDLSVLPLFGRLRRVPQHRQIGEPQRTTGRQQDLVMLEGVPLAVPVEALAGALRNHCQACVVAGLAHRTPAF